MIPSINIGPLVLPTAAFVTVIGAWICLTLAERTARWLGIDEEAMSGVVAAGLIAGILGARLTFVALYWPAYQHNLLGIVWPINSGFNSMGGLFFGTAAMFFYGRYKQLPLAPTLDALAPIIVVGLITLSLADFLGGPGFGTNTAMPWGITQFGMRRHPVQLYEIGAGLAALLTWSVMRPRRTFAGQLFLMTTAVYSFGRLFFEPFRANAWLSGDGWHIVQVICLAITLGCLILLARGSEASTKPAA